MANFPGLKFAIAAGTLSIVVVAPYAQAHIERHERVPDYRTPTGTTSNYATGTHSGRQPLKTTDSRIEGVLSLSELIGLSGFKAPPAPTN